MGCLIYKQNVIFQLIDVSNILLILIKFVTKELTKFRTFQTNIELFSR
jgi:hypothetical protein